MEDCFMLKDTIEEAVQNGKLVEFINQGGSQQGQSSRGPNSKVASFKVKRILFDSNSAVKGAIMLSVTIGDNNHKVCPILCDQPLDGIQCHLWKTIHKDGENGDGDLLHENQIPNKYQRRLLAIRPTHGEAMSHAIC
ncbi:hypothetical protein J1N35_008220 [Gossypium stocksii]|uniref:Uncharacterized protein n=1 Tax=Gossypium stocksii TaxID=47602 RepID=A0A9D3W906_9ROSI|nr:hypothetical protein J1N35_008220 [Gossypium stocksii]